MRVGNSRLAGTLLITLSASLALAACSSSGRYRIAGIGQQPSSSGGGGSSSGGAGASSGGASSSSSGGASNSGGTGSSGGAGSSSGGTGSSSGGSSGGGMQGSLTANEVIVAAGNAVIGLGAKHNEIAGVVNGALPGAQPVTGKVTRVLTGTGQAVVDIGNGRSVVLAGLDSRLGDLVTLDLGGTALVGRNGTPLIGVSVLSPGQAEGRLVTVGLAGAGNASAINLDLKDGLLGNTPGAGGVLTGVTGGAVGSLLGGVTGGTGGNVVGGVTGAVADVVGGVTGGAGGGLAGGITGGGSANGGIGGVVAGVTGGIAGGAAGGVTGGITGGAGGGGLLTGATTTVGNALGHTGLIGGGLGGLLGSQ